MRGRVFNQMTAEAWVALVCAFLGFVGTVGMLIMNLSIRGAMQDGEKHQSERSAKIEGLISEARAGAAKDSSDLKVEVANLRTRIAEEHVAIYQRIMDSMDKTYMNREASVSMHQSNTKRLDMIEGRLATIEERLPA